MYALPCKMVSNTSGSSPHLDLAWSAAPLSVDTCEDLQQLCSAYPEVPTRVVAQDRLGEHRICRTHMIPHEPQTESLYRLLLSAAVDAAGCHYGLELTGIRRMPHYVEYHAGRGHFHWHNDYSHESDEAPRKLTVVVQLSH